MAAKLDSYTHENTTLLRIYDYEHELFKIDQNLAVFRDLKEMYIDFNNKYVGNPKEARKGLDDILLAYRNSGFKMFEEIADTLDNYKEQILNSFIMIERTCRSDTRLRRLSNGPMESLNRIPKDMKRHVRGYGNFEHIRNRFLFSQRKNAAILAVPKPWKDVCFRTDNTRGPYKKHAVKGPKLR